MADSSEITITEISDPEHPLYYTGFPIRDHTSPRQHWILLKTAENDEMLFIDGQHQSSLSDEHIYHELFVHTIMNQVKNPKSVLILGGAEGCMAREVLKWKSIEKIKQVDWDASLVHHFQNEGGYWNDCVYSNPRVDYECEEADYWLSKNSETFDVILVDLLDPTENNIDFVNNIIEKCRNIINRGGAFSINVGQITEKNTIIPKFIQSMKTIFRIPHFDIFATRAVVPSYQGTWCFLSAFPANHKNNFYSQNLPINLKCVTKDLVIKNSSWYSEWPKALQSISYLNPLSDDPKKLAEEQRALEAKIFGCYGC
jgi:spermidine synthase